MGVVHFVHFKRTGRGGSSQPGGWSGRRDSKCSSARGEREARAGRESMIIFEGHLSAQKRYLDG